MLWHVLRNIPLCCVLFVIGFSAILVGCQSPGSRLTLDTGEVDLRKSDLPFIVIERTGVGAQGGAGKGGVIAAVWYDGTVVRSHSQQLTTPKLEKGKLTNDHMGVLIKRVRMAFDKMPETGIPGHAVADVMMVQMKSGARYMATTELSWQEHPIAKMKMLIFSIHLRNVAEIDALPFYSDSKPYFMRHDPA